MLVTSVDEMPGRAREPLGACAFAASTMTARNLIRARLEL